MKNGEKIRKVAKETGIDKSTLCRCVKKQNNEQSLVAVGYWGNRKIFDQKTEAELREYLKSSARMNFGRSRKAGI